MSAPYRASHPRLRRWSQAALGVLTALALVATSHGQAAAVTPQQNDKPWQPQKTKSVKGKPAQTQSPGDDPGAQLDVKQVPDVKWPAAAVGAATVLRPAGLLMPPGTTTPRTPLPLATVDRGRAGQLPVWISAPAAAAAKSAGSAGSADDVPSKVRVNLLGRKGDDVWLKVGRADGVAKPGQVRLEFSYNDFRNAFGGDWASRLRIVQVPACAVAARTAIDAGKAPAAVQDCVGKVLPTRNDSSGVLSAEVPLAAGGDTLFAVQAGASSGVGDFKSTSLAPTATWAVGGSAGDFTWNYPMSVPPGLGGPAAQLAIGYSSGGLDGRTSATNNQPSWVGEGFEFSPGGSIERRYRSCATEKDGNNGTRAVGDLCWATDNATFQLNGAGGELVKDDATGKWHPRNDDGSTVERLVGAPNGDNDGEYWLMTAKDGTKYYFGKNRLPGWVAGNPETKSAFTVPVFGNHGADATHPEEPCHQTTFAASWCNQAYRWNLDYVVDRHGNTMSLFYDVETNNYARNGTATSVSQYTRGGQVARIEYGQRDGQVYTAPPVAGVLFTPAERCVPGSTCTTSDPKTYPDTPLDRLCTSTTNCDNKFNPTFFTTKRLAKVTSRVWRGANPSEVDTWTFRHSFRDPGDGTRAGLWLEAITEAGMVGSALAMPEVNFDSVQLANRVDSADDQLAPMNWLRVSAIRYGTGGRLSVTYSAPDCKPGDVLVPDTNGRRCHPMKWTPDGQTTERTDWFHKYVVVKVLEADLVSSAEPVTTSIEYPSPPMWHHDDEDGLVDINQKTWAQWRGYATVVVKKGNVAGQQTITESRYFRGMKGDKKADGTLKDVKVTDSTGGMVDDLAPLAGQVREQRSFGKPDEVISRTITDQWVSKATATRVSSWGTVSAFQTQQAGNRQAEALPGGAFRQSAANNVYDVNDPGVLLASNDQNDLSTTADDTCTSYEYVKSADGALAELPKRTQTVAVACGKPVTNEQVISDYRTYYDNATSPDTAPVNGDVTKTERLAEFNPDGTRKYQTVSTAKYDNIGRATQVTDALNHTTTTSFGPAGAVPVTQTTVTQANGQRTITELEPAWGKELAVTDPGSRRTEATYDALGRTTKVWLPGRTGSVTPASAAKPGANVAGLAAAADNAAVPNMEYSYKVSETEANAVSTKTLQTDGSVEEKLELSDGLLRTRQTQEPSPGGGSMLTYIQYDSRGLAIEEDGPYYSDLPPTDVLTVPASADVPTQQVTEYDEAGRPKSEIFQSYGDEQWRTTHDYSGDAETVTPPQGDAPTTKITDVQGRLTELRQYAGATATGNPDKTGYSYDKAGRLSEVKDPAGNRWAFEYDIRGRKIKDIDPDRGETTYTYNDLDQMVTTKDAREVVLAYTYDDLGRRTSIRDGSVDGPKRAEWVYDTLSPGLLTSSTRWIAGQAYTTKITGYDPATGKAQGAQVILPASEGALARTYSTAMTYKPDGQIATNSLPDVGGLPAETLTYGYNSSDQPTTLKSDLTNYVRGTKYNPLGDVEQVTLGSTGGKYVQIGYQYEDGTRRLSRVTTSRETPASRISDVEYNYDPGGNITKIVDTPSSTSGQPTDTQCFNYDNLRRLKGAWTPKTTDCTTAPTKDSLGGPAPYWHQWSFDQTGNRKTETRTGPLGTTNAVYSYPAAGQARPHAVQSVVTTGTGMPAGGKTDSYQYDATGDVQTRTLAGAGETMTWNAEGDLEKVTAAGKTTEYVYDADGNRLLRRDPTGTTLYLGDTEVLLNSAGTLEGTRYYQHGGQTVAVRTGGKLNWVGADHHGTDTTVIDDTPQQNVQRRRSDPYGNSRGTAPAAWPGQRGFVGGTEDGSTGLVHLGAREYDPTLGRFISVDPEADFSDPQTLNGYSYANNNPITFTDADGRSWFSDVVSSIKTVAETVVNRVVETVKTVVQVVAPVINWVVDQVTKVVEQVKTFVQKAVEVVKKVVKTVKKVIKKVIKTVQKVIKKVAKVAKAAVAKVKTTVAKAAGAVKSAVTAAARTVAKAATDVGAWAWRNREQILSTALDIGLTIAACAGTAGAGCVARGLLFVATTALADAIPTGAAAAAAPDMRISWPEGYGPTDPKDWVSETGMPNRDLAHHEKATTDYKYQKHTPAGSDTKRYRYGKLSPSIGAKYSAVRMLALDLFGKIFG